MASAPEPMSEDSKQRAIDVLRILLIRNPELEAMLTTALVDCNNCGECVICTNKGRSPWWAIHGWHFQGGMHIRNYLRQRDCSEKDLGVSNLDDHYIPLLEAAYKQLHPNSKWRTNG